MAGARTFPVDIPVRSNVRTLTNSASIRSTAWSKRRKGPRSTLWSGTAKTRRPYVITAH